MEALENLEVWRRSCRLSASVYKSLSNCKDYGFKDQVTRSALSVASNIAEGYERDSQKSCIQFLKIAKGSCGELWTQLLIGREAGFIEKEIAIEFAEEAKELAKMLNGLIKHFDRKVARG